MSINLRFGKIRVKNNPSLDDLIEVRWTSDIPKKRGGTARSIEEDFFVDCCYDLLLALRPYPDDNDQLILIDKKIMKLIDKAHDYCKSHKVKRKYKLYALWLKYWATLAIDNYESKATLVSNYKCNSYPDQIQHFH